MKVTLVLSLIVLAAFGVAAALFFRNTTPHNTTARTMHEFTLNDIEGKPKKLSDYKGKVALVVNVASKCGLTPQYEGLEEVYQKFKDKGFVVLGFPANNFGGQEPGTEKEIQTFCTTNYKVTFPMFSKISVKGDDAHPLYQWLIAQSSEKKDIEWNFAKFLVDGEGNVIARFSSRTSPKDDSVIQAIEKALAK